jgi:hypothetical protein
MRSEQIAPLPLGEGPGVMGVIPDGNALSDFRA